jgi:hypothetical protein
VSLDDERGGLFMTKTLKTTAGPIGVRTLVAGRGAFVIEVTGVHAPDLEQAALLDLGRRAFEALAPR